MRSNEKISLGYGILMVLLILSLYVTGSAQKIKLHTFRHITKHDGLLNDEVFDIKCDKDGYIWFATLNGLQRYDGKNFMLFNKSRNNAHTFPLEGIFKIFEDSKGRLWLISNSIDLYRPYQGDLKRVLEVDFIVNDLFEDRLANIWASTTMGLKIWDESTLSFIHPAQFLPKDIPILRQGSFIKDSRNNFWIFNTGESPLYWDTYTNRCYNTENNSIKSPLFKVNKKINKGILDKKGRLWLLNEGSLLYSYDETKQAYDLHPISQVFQNEEVKISDMDIHPKTGYIWLIGNKGLYEFNPESGEWWFTPVNPGDRYGLHCFAGSYCLSIDKSGNIWISTDAGVNILNPDKEYFHEVEGLPIEWRTKSIEGFTQHLSGDLFCVYKKKGIIRVDENLTVKAQYLYKEFIPSISELNEVEATEILADWKGYLWVGLNNGEIWRINPYTGKSVNMGSPMGQGNQICKLYLDTEGKVWVGFWFVGFLAWDEEKGEFVKYNELEDRSNTNYYRIWGMLKTDSAMWIGSFINGFQKYDLTLKCTVESYYPEKKPESISSSLVNTLCLLDSTRILIATLEGINIFDSNKRTFKVISGANGLNSNMVSGIVVDNKSRIWTVGSSTLSQFCLQSEQVYSYGEEYGLKNKGFLVNGIQRLRDGRIAIATNLDLMVFNPDSLSASLHVPEIHITEFGIFDKRIVVDSLLHVQKPLSLSYKENHFSIAYGSKDIMTKLVRHRYMLEGFDKQWLTGNQQQTAYYTNIPPGDYRFMVQAIGKDGTVSNIAELNIEIIPPFWLRTWFVLFCSLAIIGSVGWIVKLQIDQIYHRVQAMRMMVNVQEKERERIAQDLHDNIGGLLSLLRIQLEPSGGTFAYQLSSIKAAIDEINDELRNICNNILPQVIKRRGIVDSVQELVYKLSNAQTPVKLQVVGEESILSFEKRLVIYRIIQELLNNGFKHAHASYIHIALIFHQDRISITYEDDGVGMKAQDQALNLGQGLGNIEARVRYLGGEWEIDSMNNEGGVSILVNIPNHSFSKRLLERIMK